MICVCVSNPDFQKCLDLVKKVELAEIRLDLTGFSASQVDQLVAINPNMVLTCRPVKALTEQQRKELLIHCAASGARYVDVEIETDYGFKKEIIQQAAKSGCSVIVSYHNFMETPSSGQLKIIVQQCFDAGAQVAKLACMANKPEDNAAILSVYEPGKRIISIGMGEYGRVSRLAAPLVGAEFTYVAPDDETGTAPGQLKYSQLKEIYKMINDE